MLGLDPDGRRVAVGGPETALHDAATLGRLATSDLSTDKVAFHPDGRQLAVAVNESFAARIVQLLDPLTLEETAVRLGGLPDPHRSLVYDLGFSADGRFLTASVGCCEHGNGTDSTLVWDLAAPERPLPVLEGGVRAGRRHLRQFRKRRPGHAVGRQNRRTARHHPGIGRPEPMGLRRVPARRSHPARRRPRWRRNRG
jgi:hypothetical protein